ncbi:RodZ domain-containing protein [Paenibacillus abyssi]|uniref:Transcriptional regulator n=1 Tax=Paenibacillus abyssi TaxID=1340531 RepID=A0A917FV99_9BACL|nr:helix-turn-helix domain-containing protein [Paenibacillus abyssi]GGG11818.1 transcriptional regulator [Paenibacillus abyssi]
MSELGELLKKARNERGLSLENIEEMTKIRKRYLEAIEEGDYKVLPGNFYVRAFVKNYAETVGLDAEEVLRLYNNEIPSVPNEAKLEPMMKPRRSSARTSDRWSKWGFTLLMWSFLILIGVIIYTFAINRPDDGNNNVKTDDSTQISTDSQPPAANNDTAGENGSDQPVEPEPEPSPEPEPEPEPEPTTALTLVRESASTDYYEISPAGVHTYELKVSGSGSWNEIRLGNNRGEVQHSGTDTDGTVLTFELEGSVYVNVGRADNIELRVDGILIDDKNRPSSKKLQFDPVDEPAVGE